MCPGNTIKSKIGDDINCTTLCDKEGKVANDYQTGGGNNFTKYFLYLKVKQILKSIKISLK